MAPPQRDITIHGIFIYFVSVFTEARFKYSNVKNEDWYVFIFPFCFQFHEKRQHKKMPVCAFKMKTFLYDSTYKEIQRIVVVALKHTHPLEKYLSQVESHNRYLKMYLKLNIISDGESIWRYNLIIARFPRGTFR